MDGWIGKWAQNTRDTHAIGVTAAIKKQLLSTVVVVEKDMFILYILYKPYFDGVLILISIK